jgi:hypothetical protein
MTRYTDYRRLQPQPQDRNLEQGFAATLYDPVWMLARQWQMGEHQAENASTPVRVHFLIREAALAPFQGQSALDPQKLPVEPIVEAEPESWWTMGRRIRIGNALAGQVAATPGLVFVDPPPPYEYFAGKLDGLALWRNRLALGLDDAQFGPELPPVGRPDSWDPAELVYRADFQTAQATLTLPRHAGGDIDWYSADAVLPPPQDGVPPATQSRRIAFPAQFEYPGAPNDRWWAIENGAVDIGGYPPDRSHFPTLLLIDLIVSHSTDWFLFPVATSVGRIVTLTSVYVYDSFGDRYPITPPADWSLFKTSGLDTSSLVLWPTALTPLQGPTLEEVVFGIDEYSNYLWAVEKRTHGREIPTPNQSGPKPAPNTTVRKPFEYLPARGLVRGWHPYVPRDEMVNGAPRRRFVQGKINPNLDPAANLGAPTAAVLGADDEGPLLFVHKIEPATIPSNGISVERNWMLARDVEGNPILWMQRLRKPLLAPPSRQVGFDVLQEAVDPI